MVIEIWRYITAYFCTTFEGQVWAWINEGALTLQFVYYTYICNLCGVMYRKHYLSVFNLSGMGPVPQIDTSVPQIDTPVTRQWGNSKRNCARKHLWRQILLVFANEILVSQSMFVKVVTLTNIDMTNIVFTMLFMAPCKLNMRRPIIDWSWSFNRSNVVEPKDFCCNRSLQIKTYYQIYWQPVRS